MALDTDRPVIVEDGNDKRPAPGLLVQEKPSSAPSLSLSSLRNMNASMFFAALAEFLKPEFLTRRKNNYRVGPTAFLDGLRGVAAFIVCIMHLCVYTHTDMELCYGAQLPNGKSNVGIAALPILRIPFTGGHFSVMVFFVISGYVVPRRLVSLLHEGRKDDFIEAVNSALFRRVGRLYLPVMMSTLFLALVMGHIIGLDVPFPHYKGNIIHEAYNWCQDMMMFLNFFRTGPLFTWYNFHTWTLPVELRGSMFLFIFLFAFHQVRTRSRVLICTAFTLHLALGTPGAWYACFFAGMLTSELDMLAADGDQIKMPWHRVTVFLRQNKLFTQTLLHTMLFIGLYFGSQPSSDGKPREQVLGDCPGWKTLNYIMPNAYKDGPPGHVQYRWFYFFWGAWFTVIAVKEIDWVRWLFETRTAQYLGRHSFALYLIHGPMIGIYSERLFYLTGVKTSVNAESLVKFGHLQDRWKNLSWWPFPDGGPPGLEPNFLVCVVLSLPVFLYIAEIGTKCFDEPSIKMTNWMWKKVKTLR